MKPAQRGIGLLITVSLILVVAAFAVLTAATFSGSSIRDTAAYGESTEALYLAETGLERAIKRFVTGTACGAGLLEGPIALTTAGKTYEITKAASTDFSGAALGSTQCRIEIEGRLAANNVRRRIQAIVDSNLIGGSANGDFNNPPGGAPQSWTGGSFDFTGGADPTANNPPACSRAAYVVKPRTGVTTATAAANTAVNFSVPAGTVLNISFDYRIMRIGNAGPSGSPCTTSAGGGACPGAADPSSPSGAAGEGEICFSVTDSLGVTSNSTKYTVDPTFSIATTVTPPSCTPTTQQVPATYSPCGAKYNFSGAGDTTPARGTVTITVGGAGTRTITTFTLNLFLKSGSAKELWLDNIIITSGSGSGAARAALWRDCTVASCP